MKKIIFFILILFFSVNYFIKTKFYLETMQSIDKVKIIYYQTKASMNDIQQLMSTTPNAIDQFNSSIKELEKMDDESIKKLNSLN